MGDTPNSSLNSGGAAHGMLHTYWRAGLEGGRAFGDCIFRAWFSVLGGFEAGGAWVGDVMGRDEMRRDATTWGGTKADSMEWSSPVVSSRSFASSGSSGERVEEAEIPREGRLGLGWISVGLGRGWGLGITVIHTRTCNAGAGRFSFWRWTRFVFLLLDIPDWLTWTSAVGSWIPGCLIRGPMPTYLPPHLSIY